MKVQYLNFDIPTMNLLSCELTMFEHISSNKFPPSIPINTLTT